MKTACHVLILRTPFWPLSDRDTWLDGPLVRRSIYSGLQYILLSGIMVDKSQLWDKPEGTWPEGTLSHRRRKQKINLDKRPWEVEKK